MDFICTTAHLGVYFESVQVVVILSFTTGSDSNYELYADEIVPRNETEWLTPRMYFICARAHFGVAFEFIRIGVNVFSTTGFDRYYKLQVYATEVQNQTEFQNPRRDFIFTLAHVAMHFEPVRVGVKLSCTMGTMHCVCTK